MPPAALKGLKKNERKFVEDAKILYILNSFSLKHSLKNFLVYPRLDVYK
jgi:hypothetical protein